MILRESIPCILEMRSSIQGSISIPRDSIFDICKKCNILTRKVSDGLGKNDDTMSFRLQDVSTTVILPTTFNLQRRRWRQRLWRWRLWWRRRRWRRRRQQLYCLPNLTKPNWPPNLTLRGYLTRRRHRRGSCRWIIIGKTTLVKTAVGKMTFSQKWCNYIVCTHNIKNGIDQNQPYLSHRNVMNNPTIYQCCYLLQK